MSYAGHKFLPRLDPRSFGLDRRLDVNPHGAYRLGPGLGIVSAYADLHESEYDPRFPGDDYYTVIYEVYVDGRHVATAASLEAALSVLHDKYTATLPF